MIYERGEMAQTHLVVGYRQGGEYIDRWVQIVDDVMRVCGNSPTASIFLNSK